MAELPHQSLYRQYRPQRFSEVRGQDHVTRALRNAARADRVGHSYLFSGPRGTGKTSTARILAKALNCAALEDGEPCGVCPSCLAVQAGTSLDVLELDAASNNGVEAMRDLVARAALGTPGRWKVYIVDEVHMLSTPASNALLKTLEEPPGHVVFVLATTDPQKVLPTIRSRTQHFEFHLLGPDVLSGLLRDVNADAKLGLDEGVLDQVVRKGAGSARDALSVLDQVVAAGGAEEGPDTAPAVVDALCDRDAGQALAAVAAACRVGRDPRRIGVEVIERLRQGLLTAVAPSLVDVPSEGVPALQDQAKRLGNPALVRAMEVLGEALVAMRDALDTRVTLEVALVRLCAPEADASMAAVLERVDRLERRLGPGAAGVIAPPGAGGSTGPGAGGSTGPGAGGSTTSGAGGSTASGGGGSTGPGTNDPAGGARPPGEEAGPPAGAGSRLALGALRRAGEGRPGADPEALTAKATAAADSAVAASASAGAASAADRVPAPDQAPPGAIPTRDEITKAWGDSLLASLPPGARSVFRTGRWVAVEGGAAVFAVPNSFHLERADVKRSEVEQALSTHFGVRVALRLVEDDGLAAAGAGLATSRAGAAPDDDESLTSLEVAGLVVADQTPPSPEDRLKQAFPGAEEVPT